MRPTRFIFTWILSVFVSIVGSVGLQTCQAQGVSVTPLRVLFDGRTRSTTVFLSNRTSTANSYRIELVNRRMLQDGNIVPAEEAGPGEYFADELISFSPRRVTIAPQAAQTIRLLVRRPRGEIPDDIEYRTHMSIRSIPPTPRLEDIENLERVIEEQRIEVQPQVTVETVIPILIRFGDPKAQIRLTRPSFVNVDPELGYSALTIDMERSGDRSVYGDLEVFHTPIGGREERIFITRSLAIYSPVTTRTKRIRFRDVDPAHLTSGTLRVRYTETPDMHGDQTAELIYTIDPGVHNTP
jgi:P pilus assembly chaperone PapD